MEMISAILLTVVLLAQIVLFVLFFLEKRRNNRRYDAMLDYIDRVESDGIATCNYTKSLRKEIKEQFKSQEEKAEHQRDDILQEVNKELAERDAKISERIEALLLDYREAQAAANKINDFGTSLANIFDYDPIRAVQKGRKKEAG